MAQHRIYDFLRMHKGWHTANSLSNDLNLRRHVVCRDLLVMQRFAKAYKLTFKIERPVGKKPGRVYVKAK